MQNKKLRKALAVSMAIAMTGGLLAGCGSNNSSSSNGGAAKSGSTSSASGELDTSEFVELSMYRRESEQTLKRETELLFEN